MKRPWLVLASVLVLIAIGAYFWLRQAPPQALPPVAVVSPAPIAPPPRNDNAGARGSIFRSRCRPA